MIDRLKYIEINGTQIPYLCTIQVLADIQEEYGTIEHFEKELLGIVDTDKNGKATKTKEPSIKAAVWGISLMIEQGIRKYNRDKDAAEKIDFKIADVGDIDKTPDELKTIVHNAFVESIQVKKGQPPQASETEMSK